VYVAFVIDVSCATSSAGASRLSLRSYLALDDPEQALWAREAGGGLVHRSDRGVQYLSIRYTERLAEAGIEASVGSKGDSYDNALADAKRALQGRVIHRQGP
jgi:transposase InsO family protein